jgi:hypothetical protein
VSLQLYFREMAQQNGRKAMNKMESYLEIAQATSRGGHAGDAGVVLGGGDGLDSWGRGGDGLVKFACEISCERGRESPS